MEKRRITVVEEKVYRMYTFEHQSQGTIAIKLGCSKSTVSKTLTRLRKKAPQLFPVLTEEQEFIRLCINECGLTHQEIAYMLEIKKSTLHKIIRVIRQKGAYIEYPKKTLNYESWMDGKVVRTF